MKKENNMQISNRLTAILVAVVFVVGTMFIPTEIFAVEPDASGDVVEVAEATTEAVDAETTGEEPAAAETEVTEVTEPTEQGPENADADLTDFLSVTDENGDNIDIEDLDEDTYDGFIYKIKDDTTDTELKEMEEAIDDLDKKQEIEEVISEELYSADSLETIAEVTPPERIEYIEPNYIMTAMGTNDPNYAEYGWYLDMINAPYVWEKGMIGDGATVAILDSGVKIDHEEFEQTVFTGEYNAIDPTEDLTDNSGHGTAVTGIIAAAQNNQKGLTGIMPRAKVMPVKVMDYNLNGETTGTVDDVIQGMNYAVNNGADVINISAGIQTDIKSLREACQNAAARGVILVAAAGNDFNSIAEYPAAYDTVIGVGSIERDGAHSDFSNYNQSVAVSAPGRGIRTPYKNGRYASYTGTSFSAPQVAAMAVMVKSIDRSINYSDFMKLIQLTSADKGTAGYDPYFGYGLMDLGKAYRYMAGDITMYDVAISGTAYVYNGKTKTPSVTVKKLGKALSAKYYKTTYSAGRTAVGTYKVTVIGINGYTGTKTLSFSINPPLVKGIKAPKRGKKKLTVCWSAMSKKQKKQYKSVITGYQVRISTNSKFTNAKYVNVKGYTKTKVTVKGLKKKTTYYVQYRSYKTVGSAAYYSNWSSVKKAKTK